MIKNIAGWNSGLIRLAHNQETVGSNPAPAIRVCRFG